MSTSLIIGDNTLTNLPVDNPSVTFIQALPIPSSTNIVTSGGIGVAKSINSQTVSCNNLTSGSSLSLSGQGNILSGTDSSNTSTGSITTSNNIICNNDYYTNILNGTGLTTNGNLNVTGNATLTGRVICQGVVRTYTRTVAFITSAFATTIFTPVSGQRGFITINGNIATHQCMIAFFFEWTNGTTIVNYTQIASSGDAAATSTGPAGTVVLFAQVSGVSLQIACLPVGTGSINYYITLM